MNRGLIIPGYREGIIPVTLRTLKCDPRQTVAVGYQPTVPVLLIELFIFGKSINRGLIIPGYRKKSFNGIQSKICQPIYIVNNSFLLYNCNYISMLYSLILLWQCMETKLAYNGHILPIITS